MKQKGFVPILIVILVAAAVLGGYFIYQNQSKLTSPSQPSPLSTEAPAKAEDPTANWKTYKNNKYGYSFKYQPDWKLLEQNDRPSITNNNAPNIKHYFNISVDVSDNTKRQSTREFINSAKILTAANVYANPFSMPKQYTNGNISGIIVNWNNGDQGAVEVVQATNTKVYEFGLLAGPDTGTLPTEEDRQIFDQILSTFKFTQ